jgi:hypothetical protein
MRTRYKDVGESIRTTKQIGKEDVEPKLVEAINAFKEIFTAKNPPKTQAAS